MSENAMNEEEKINSLIADKFKYIYYNTPAPCHKEILKIEAEIKSEVLRISKKAYTVGTNAGYELRKSIYRRDF